MNEPTDICTMTADAVCPHCGYEHPDSWEFRKGTNWCSSCGCPFHLERTETVTYTTRKLDADECD